MIHRSIQGETEDQATAADGVARATAVELVDNWIATHAQSQEYLGKVPMPMPAAGDYAQLGLALRESGLGFSLSRLSAFNDAWARHFESRVGQ